ncbi:HEAT repeat domain-containing protein [Microcystis aeruginosa CS-1036]|uniref:HEAT repeat domain-containing protein n=1 Tax=Microcystis aeruginosa TaxID=1126 RepID=UPI00232C139C|nr:HEAT repeat domain-containing protein [Microcystis aeruginosa]MDB9542577.1 HEAT repeat domain-containing protein [Microcystis aeruginosa CS-1036]
MNKHLRYSPLTGLSATLLSLVSLLNPSGSAGAVTCTPEQINSPEVKSKIEQIKTKTLSQQLQIVNQWSKDLYPLSDWEGKRQEPIFCSVIATVQESTVPLEVRKNAAYVLRGIGTGAEDAIPPLKELLLDRSQPPEMRKSVIWALRGIGAAPVVHELVQVLKNPDNNDELRGLAIETLLSFTDKNVPKNAGVIPILEAILKQDTNSHLRASAAKALGQIVTPDLALVELFDQALGDPSWVVRKEAADALGRIAQNSQDSGIRKALQETIPRLRTALDDQNYTLRSYVVSALGQIGGNDRETLTKLHDILENDPNPLVRDDAAAALGILIAQKDTFDFNGDQKTLESLIKALDEEQPKAAQAIAAIAQSLPDQARNNKIDVKKAIDSLNEALAALKEKQSLYEQEIRKTEQQLEILRMIQAEQFILHDILKNPWAWAVVIVLSSYGGMFWLKPLWLLKLDEGLLGALETSAKISNPLVSAIGSVTVTFLRLLSPLKYHGRVLDAWVGVHIKSVQEAFQQKDTVEKRLVHVPSPVILNDRTTIAQLTPKHLQTTFATRKHLLIWGEGGSGKTSLACQIAQWAMSEDENERILKHRMLPVLIEDDLDPDHDKCPFTDAILGQLNDELGQDTEPISAKLLEQLLRKQRILVIVDHLSEMSAETRELIRPEMPDCPANALLITSRTREVLGHVVKTTIQPLRIEGNHLSSFMDAYLRERGKRELFPDPEFFDACRHLSQIVDRGNITLLLAKLYAEQMIASKVESAQTLTASLPDNVPDLMLHYVNELNRDVHKDKLEDRIVQKTAKIVAWECLKSTYKPNTAAIEDILLALADNTAEIRLKYLEQRLHLIQIVGPAQDRLRFALDPIAEYLAALHLLDLYRDNDSQWWEWLKHLDTTPKGFLIALRDCCQVKGQEAKVPDFVLEKLAPINGKTVNVPEFLPSSIGNPLVLS